MRAKFKAKSVVLLFAVALLYLVWNVAIAGTTGIISGIVTDAKTGAKLSGVNVVVKGTNLTTVTDANGYFVITNVPPGNYTVEATLVGYSKLAEEDIEVTMDDTNSVDFALVQEVTEEKEVAVTEKRQHVQPDVTPTLYIVDYKKEQQVKSQPNNLYQIPGIVTTQPGVTPSADGRPHIRGGRDSQVGYMVDGIPVVEPNTNVFATNTVTVGMSKLQIYTGGYRSEYGNAISGVLNEIKKTGSEMRGGGLETTAGEQNYRGAYVEYGDVASNGLDYYVGTYAWSTKFENMFFSGVDSADTVGKFVYPVSDNDRLTFLFNQGTARYYLDSTHTADYGGLVVPEEEDHGHQGYKIFGLTWAHNFSPSSFMVLRPYQVSSYALINCLSIDGPMGPTGQWQNWWSNQRGLQFEYTNQLNQNHLLKTGASVIDSNNFYHAYIPDYASVLGLSYFTSEDDPTYDYINAVDTRQTGLFIQDQIKLGYWNLEAGLRLDRMRFDKTQNADVVHDQISPRLGLSYSKDNKSAWRASWGKFIQFPPGYVMERIYTNPLWNQYREGNITLKPERSWSIDLGYERQLSANSFARLTPFYREYTDLIQSQRIPANGPRFYVNSGEGKSYGLEGYYSAKINDKWDGWLSYTYLKARANASSFSSTIDPTVSAYVDWDQRHTLTAVANYKKDKWSHSIMMNYGSGYADSVTAATADYQGRAPSSLIFSWNITRELPKGSKIGDAISLNIYNIFNVKKANHRYITPLFDDDGNMTGFGPEDDTWTIPRFITLGISRKF